MGRFVLKVYEFGVGDQLYVGEDERLWNWMNQENVLMPLRSWDTPPPMEGDFLRVLTPVGFVFYDDMLVPWDSDVALNPPEPILSEFSYVSADNPDADKAYLLVFNRYKYVTSINEEEFKDLGIGTDRVFEITV